MTTVFQFTTNQLDFMKAMPITISIWTVNLIRELLDLCGLDGKTQCLIEKITDNNDIWIFGAEILRHGS